MPLKGHMNLTDLKREIFQEKEAIDSAREPRRKEECEVGGNGLSQYSGKLSYERGEEIT